MILNDKTHQFAVSQHFFWPHSQYSSLDRENMSYFFVNKMLLSSKCKFRKSIQHLWCDSQVFSSFLVKYFLHVLKMSETLNGNKLEVMFEWAKIFRKIWSMFPVLIILSSVVHITYMSYFHSTLLVKKEKTAQFIPFTHKDFVQEKLNRNTFFYIFVFMFAIFQLDFFLLDI